MKIGITCYPTYGGSGVVATELGMELAARGHEIHFISYAPPARLTASERITFHEVEISSYPLFDHAPYALTLAVKMLEVAEVVRPGPAARALRDSAFGERDAGAVDGGRRDVCRSSPRCTARTSPWWATTAAFCRSRDFPSSSPTA